MSAEERKLRTTASHRQDGENQSLRRAAVIDRLGRIRAIWRRRKAQSHRRN
jgi:hypothetical protein